MAAWYLESILLKRRLAERSCVKNIQKPSICQSLLPFLGTTGLTNDETMLTSSFFFATYFESIYFLKVSLGEQSGGASSEPLDEAVQGFIKFA